jgi:hypothetical protein
VELLKRFEKDGALPATRDASQYEAVAQDLVEACRSGNADALKRVVNHFQIGRMTTVDQLRRQVRRRLGIQAANDESCDLTVDQAQLLVARLHGVQSWSELIASH